MRSANFQIYGQAEPPLELLPLRAGPLTLLYDPRTAMIRRIKLGNCEVLRGIYAAVRDRNWGTVTAVIQETRRELTADSFQIEFTSVHQRAEIDFVWRGLIQGSKAGKICYEFDGESRGNFLRNRIGFCVLHPIAECAGASARQTRIDGQVIECRFPELIEPQIFGRSSFQQLRSVVHEVAPGIRAEVSFEGDTFEMEDQRNWTDASFKTYCTPLTLPFPVEIKRGDTIKQSVELQLVGFETSASTVEVNPSGSPKQIRLIIPDAPNADLPGIGLGAASHGEPLSETELRALRRLKLSHLRADVRLGDPSHLVRLRQWLEEAASLDTKLEVALHLPHADVLNADAALQLLQQRSVMIRRILALREGEAATSQATLAWAHNHLGKFGTPIASGTDCNFCELNREHAIGHLGLDGADLLFWSINPQVHAVDHLSVMETLDAQAATVQTARTFAGGRELIISPVTLKPRFNPVATGIETVSDPDELPPQVDSRQLSQFAAAWTLGSIAALATAGVAGVTYCETAGWRGVMEKASGSPLPDRFSTEPGELFPVFDVFAKIAGFKSCAVVQLPDNLDVVGLSLFSRGGLERTLVANLTTRVVQVQTRRGGNRSLDFTLGPYAIRELDHHAR